MTAPAEDGALTAFTAVGCQPVEGENLYAARSRGSAAACALEAADLIRRGDMVRAAELLDSAQYYLGRWKDKQ